MQIIQTELVWMILYLLRKMIFLILPTEGERWDSKFNEVKTLVKTRIDCSIPNK